MTIPDDVSATNVTVEVGTDVVWIQPNGAAWTPRITVEGAPRGFYSIRVDK